MIAIFICITPIDVTLNYQCWSGFICAWGGQAGLPYFSTSQLNRMENVPN